MRHLATRAVLTTALMASLLLPAHAGAAPEQDVSAGLRLNAAHDGNLAGATERPPLTRAWAREFGYRVNYTAIAEGKVFVIAGSDTQVRLHALDAVTGADVWGPVVLGADGKLVYGAGRIFVVDHDGRMRAFDAATGRLEWDVTVSVGNTSAPTYANGRIFVDTSYGVDAVSAADGRLLWHGATAGGWGESSPAVTDTGVYVSYYAAEAWAFDPATGAVLWHNEPRNVAGGGRAPTVAGGRVWTLDPFYDAEGTEVRALDPATGALTGTYRSHALPAFDGSTGYFTLGRVLEARNILTGALRWSFAADGAFTTAPIVVNGFVYASSDTGHLWALDPSTGVPVWSDRIDIPVPNDTRGKATALGAGQGLVVASARPALVAYAGAPAGVRSPWIASVHAGVSNPVLGNDTSPAVMVSSVVPGETVALKEGGTVRATRAVPAGAATVTFNAGPTSADFTLAGEGDHVLSAEVVGGGPLVRPSGPFTYTLDTLPPPAPVLEVDVATTRERGDARSPSMRVSNVKTGDTVSVLVDGVVRATRVVYYRGSVDIGPPFAPDELGITGYGTHLLTATVTEPAGNVSAPSAAVPYDLVNEPGRFHGLEPSRILDTRVGTAGPVRLGATLTVPVAGRGGVPATGASAVVVNVTVTQPSTGGFLTVFPTGTARPLASSLNFAAGETVPNLVVAKLGADGKISLYNDNGTSHVILDVVGWYQADGVWTGGLYNPLSPTRILDTRNGTGVENGVSKPIGPGGVTGVRVAGQGGVSTRTGVAVVLNVTVTEPSTGGFLTVYPTARPLASNLNFVAGETVANLVVTKLSVDGWVRLYNNAGTAHVVVDVVGWYTPDRVAEGSPYHPVDPSRILDTRTGGSRPVGPGASITVPVAGRGGVPATGASAVVANVTVTQPSVGGFLTVFPGGTARPLASSLNFVAGQTVPNLVVAKLGADGSIGVYNNAGTSHVILDVVGWYGA